MPEVVIIRTDGTSEAVTLHQREFAKAVGGYLEAITVPDGTTTFFMNEEGKIHGLAQNTVATAIWWVLDPRFANHDDLRGDIVVTGGMVGEDTILDITDTVKNFILENT